MQLRLPRGPGLRAAAALVASVVGLVLASGVLFWPLLGIAIVSLVGVVAAAARRWRGPSGEQAGLPRGVAMVALVVLPLALLFACIEVFLAWVESRYELSEAELRVMAPESEAAREALARFVWGAPRPDGDLSPPLPPELRSKIGKMHRSPVLPRAWEKRTLFWEDGVRHYTWHAVVHVKNPDGMRRVGPFPARDPERTRIMVVGDSLTVGKGIDLFWTYPHQLQLALAPRLAVEVLNAGEHGAQSEEILGNLRRFLPELEPDLVVYGVCQNDFLPLGRGQSVERQVPLPEGMKKYLTRRSLLGRLIDERFDVLLRKLGIRHDFYAEMLAEIDTHAERFGRDVAAMNAAVLERGLPPVVAMVLDQFPSSEGPGRRLARVAEERLSAAGMLVIESEPFYRRFDGQDFRISRFEGHPNEEANVIWAGMFQEALLSRSELAAYRRAAGRPEPSRPPESGGSG